MPQKAIVALHFWVYNQLPVRRSSMIEVAVKLPKNKLIEGLSALSVREIKELIEPNPWLCKA
jgi:hypothetical protein